MDYWKLIELLNEYDRIKWDKEEPIYNWKIAIKTKLYKAYLISSNYGFIEWLVENEKIDFEWKLNTFRFNSLVDQTLDSYLALLMLLSIQDEPIEFLISILKNV
jgi:hypothetical protein